MKRLLVVLLLAGVVALPFFLRPRQGASGAADDTVVVVTPHNEAIRHEFALGFERWYRARTGRSVFVDWRMPGGSSEISRYLEGEYTAAFRALWSGRLGRPWSVEVQAAFQDGRLPGDAPAAAREARAEFLASDAGCGIDVFFGGGAFDFDQQALAGRIVASAVVRNHPDWFSDAAIPQAFGGQPFRDPEGRWFGSVISCYGIVFNRDALRSRGVPREPSAWSDLADPRLAGAVALCDPTKSGSIAMAFENVIQQQMQQRLAGMPEDQAIREGWLAGLRLVQLIGANARYFTDSSQKPPIDVADGNCAAGMCIDFYGIEQVEAVRRRGDPQRLGFLSPQGGTSYAVDPIALLRGARHRAVAEAFIEFVLSLDGQKLWAFAPGAPGGPREYALRRLPVRRDFYDRGDWARWRTDPGWNPYAERDLLVYRPQWTGPLFRPMALIIRTMCQDTHEDLVRAWRAILAAREPDRSRALAALQDVRFAGYDRAGGEIRAALASRNQVDEMRVARSLAAEFRKRYAAAEALALGRRPP